MVLFLKKYSKYFFLFLFFFFLLLVFSFYNHSYDSFWNYSFSYAVARGEIPYVDFNMISTPFSSFFFAIFLIFNHNYLCYLLGWSLVLTFTFYLLYQLLGHRCWILLFCLLFPFLHTIIPTYNLFCFCIFVFLLYLEKAEKSDLIIGFVVGLSILTKHTLGIFFLLANIFYYRKNQVKLCMRLFGCFIPCFVFLVYLIFTESLFQFLDLCVFGLLDFSKNGSLLSIYLFLSLLLLLFLICYIKKDRSLNAYYTLGTFAFTIPLFDMYHFLLFFCCCMTFFLLQVKVSVKVSHLFLILSIILCLVNFYVYQGFFSRRLSFLPNLKYFLVNPNQYQLLYDMNQVFFKYYDKDTIPIILSTKSAFIYTGNDIDVNYFLVFLKGNYGYHGSGKLIDKISRSDDIYIINRKEMKEIGNDGDYLYEVCVYVTKHFHLLEQVGDYLVYRRV